MYVTSVSNQLPLGAAPRSLCAENKDDFVSPEWRLRMYQNSFLPYAVSLWNYLDEDTRTIANYEIFKGTLMGNANDNSLFRLGTRQDQIIITKLRMHFSNLKGHLYSIKIIESSACSCGFVNEDEIHVVCPLYNRPRVTLLNALMHILPLTVKTLLYGNDNLELAKNGDLDLCFTLPHSIHTEYYAEVWGVSKEGVSSEEKAKKKWIAMLK